MLQLTLTNLDTSYSVELTRNESALQLVRVDGLAPVPAALNIASVAGMDGGKYNSSKLETRNIVIMLRLNDAKTQRQSLERNFPTKARVKVNIVMDTDTNVDIEGYVNTFECDIFSETELAQISIICPNPYFTLHTGSAGYIVNWQTGATVTTDSSIPVGVELTATINSSLSAISFINSDSGEAITLQYVFEAGDQVRIDTRRGSRSVKLTRSGVTTTVFGIIKTGSLFWGVDKNHNHVAYTINNNATDPGGKASVGVIYTQLIAGV